jgi:hypothetical protein
MSSRPPIRRAANMPRPEERKRSLQAPLWAIGIALVGYPLLRDATADKMQRNTYRNAESCACAYSPTQCSRDENSWVGPWYASRAGDRKYDDPGEGQYCRTGTSGMRFGSYGGTSGDGAVEPATGTQRGYRGGFGGTGRVRAAGG